MIIWINGPFGVGKSTLARSLAALQPDWMTYDPEWFGAILHRLVPPSPTGDYQDLPYWRAMTAHGIIEMSRSYGKTVIVPMTMVRTEYLNEIHGRINAAGIPLTHVFLDADADTLRTRIVGDTVDVNAREWRLEHLERCLDARSSLPPSTVFLDAGDHTPQNLARIVISHLASRNFGKPYRIQGSNPASW